MRLAKDRAHVRVPATSGNLGPGFDCMGMAHDIWDDIEVCLTTGATRVEIEGEGADVLPRDESHLIIVALKRALDVAGIAYGGFDLHCVNRIRQGRGLGSSAAAVVAGLMLARGLVDEPELLSDEVLLTLATDFEGHPDNAAPAIYGGAVVTWTEAADETATYSTHDGLCAKAAPIQLAENLRTTLLVPDFELATSLARSVLPESVPHKDAAFNASRAAMLVLALEGRSDMFMQATGERLHQDYRADSMRPSIELMQELRDAGYPTVVSGAGPSLLVFGELSPQERQYAAGKGFAAYDSGYTPGAQIL
ncbi:MAG: homoserine kinase [Actinomycetaceae bacterium]|nr:homoserine kinase [Actinomycetaceae bacterium]